MKKIGVFGGAFNPPTLGHLFVIQKILKSEKIDRIFVLLDGKRDDKEYGITQNTRKELFKLFLQELSLHGCEVETDYHFFNQDKATLTYDVDLYFRKKFPQDIIFHIFGSDVIKNISHWTGNPNHYLEKTLHKLFIRRSGFPVDGEYLKDMKNYSILDTDSPHISSTMVREKIQKKEDFSSFVPKNIYDFIVQYQLYQ